MSSSTTGSGGDHSPAAAPPRGAAVVDNHLHDLRKNAVMLQTMLEGSPTPQRAATRELMDGVMTSLTSAISALNTSEAAGGGGGAASSAGGRRGSGGRRRAVAGPIRRIRGSSSYRRRTQSPFVRTVTTTKVEGDGHAWRKYGQKDIHGSEHPRSYYRCTHKPDQGCMATKQVQASDTNPLEFMVNYFGHHTCRDPSTVPLVIEAAVAAPPNFICFGSGSTTIGATTSSTSSAHAIVPHRQPAAIDPTKMMMISRFAGDSTSLPAAAAPQERCGSEEAISSSPGAWQLDAVVGSNGRTMPSTTVVGSAPEYWPSEDDMAGGGGGIDRTGSFPSSPSTSSLGGFMAAGSFGSFGNSIDDGIFGFDP